MKAQDPVSFQPREDFPVAPEFLTAMSGQLQGVQQVMEEAGWWKSKAPCGHVKYGEVCLELFGIIALTNVNLFALTQKMLSAVLLLMATGLRWCQTFLQVLGPPVDSASLHNAPDC